MTTLLFQVHRVHEHNDEEGVETVAHETDAASGRPQDGDAGEAGRIPGLIAAVEKSPSAAALTVGLALILAALARNVAGIKFEHAGSRSLTLAVGAALCVVAIGAPMLSSRFKRKNVLASVDLSELPDEAYDGEFLLKVFLEAMPPAFIKRVDVTADGKVTNTNDILYSAALLRHQRHTKQMAPDRRYKMIKKDHLHGDQVAVNDGMSVQLELPDSYVHGRLRPIITFKTVIRHKGRCYVAGWYVPVRRDDVPAGADDVCLEQELQHVLFRLAPARDNDDGTLVPLGQAVKSGLHTAVADGHMSGSSDQ